MGDCQRSCFFSGFSRRLGPPDLAVQPGLSEGPVAVRGPEATVEVGPEHVALVIALGQLDPRQREVVSAPSGDEL